MFNHKNLITNVKTHQTETTTHILTCGVDGHAEASWYGYTIACEANLEPAMGDLNPNDWISVIVYNSRFSSLLDQSLTCRKVVAFSESGNSDVEPQTPWYFAINDGSNIYLHHPANSSTTVTIPGRIKESFEISYQNNQPLSIYLSETTPPANMRCVSDNRIQLKGTYQIDVGYDNPCSSISVVCVELPEDRDNDPWVEKMVVTLIDPQTLTYSWEYITHNYYAYTINDLLDHFTTESYPGNEYQGMLSIVLNLAGKSESDMANMMCQMALTMQMAYQAHYNADQHINHTGQLSLKDTLSGAVQDELMTIDMSIYSEILKNHQTVKLG